jgi:hypothetical protein
MGYTDGVNRYAYVHNNPIYFNDPNGLVARAVTTWAQTDGISYVDTGLNALTPGSNAFQQSYANYQAGNITNAAIWGVQGSVEIGAAVFTGGASQLESRAVSGLSNAVSDTRALVPYYPSNNGFLGAISQTTLQEGQLIDRFGGTGISRFFSPAGTAAELRALPPGVAEQPLRTFEVLKPITVESGTVAPAFGQLGLGTQFRSPMTLDELLNQGIIRESLK